MAPPLAQLTNLSFAAGVFPSRYKLGHVIPLLKKPGMPKKDPSIYRPITNLCTFAKILEKIVLVRLRPHVQATGNVSLFQSAYRPGYSTAEGNLDRLQRVQNQLARVVPTVPHAQWTDSATDMRRQLHWLPVRQRIVFKLAAVTYKAQQSGLPAYLQCEIQDYHPSRTLRSTSAFVLEQQPTTI